MRPALGFRPTFVLAIAFLANAGASAAAPALPATPAAPPSATLIDACPAQLPVQQTISEPFAGWTPVNQEGNHSFVRVAFYPGPPADSALIVPSIEFKGTAGLHDAWDLPRRTGGYWMTCAYGNTTATVTRRLAADVDYCQADYDGRFLTLVVKRWSCGIKRTMAPPVWAHATKSVKPAAKAATRRSD